MFKPIPSIPAVPAGLPSALDLDSVLPLQPLTNQTLLELRGLKRYFGGVKAVDDVSLEVKRGETLFHAGDAFHSVYAIRVGFFKTGRQRRRCAHLRSVGKPASFALFRRKAATAATRQALLRYWRQGLRRGSLTPTLSRRLRDKLALIAHDGLW